MGNTVTGLLKEDEDTKERLRRHLERKELRKEGKLPPREKGETRQRPPQRSASAPGEKKRGGGPIDSSRSLRRGEKENSMSDGNYDDENDFENDEYVDDSYDAEWVDDTEFQAARGGSRRQPARDDRYRDDNTPPRRGGPATRGRGGGPSNMRGGAPPQRGGPPQRGMMGRQQQPPSNNRPMQPHPQNPMTRGGRGGPAGPARGMMRPSPFPPGMMRPQGPPMGGPQQQMYPPPMTLRDAAAQKRIEALEEQVRKLTMQQQQAPSAEDNRRSGGEPEMYNSYDRKMLQIDNQARSRGRVATVIRGGHAASSDLRNMGNVGRVSEGGGSARKPPRSFSDIYEDDYENDGIYGTADRKYDSYERDMRQSGSQAATHTRLRDEMRNSGGSSAAYNVQEDEEKRLRRRQRQREFLERQQAGQIPPRVVDEFVV